MNLTEAVLTERATASVGSLPKTTKPIWRESGDAHAATTIEVVIANWAKIIMLS